MKKKKVTPWVLNGGPEPGVSSDSDEDSDY
jgi:hypothetical protein